MTTTTYSGTAREQWRLAGIDLALGRITAAELHELGEQLFADLATYESEELRDLSKQVDRAQEDCRDAEITRDALEDKLDKLRDECEELKAERNRLLRDRDGD